MVTYLHKKNKKKQDLGRKSNLFDLEDSSCIVCSKVKVASWLKLSVCISSFEHWYSRNVQLNWSFPQRCTKWKCKRLNRMSLTRLLFPSLVLAWAFTWCWPKLRNTIYHRARAHCYFQSRRLTREYAGQYLRISSTN